MLFCYSSSIVFFNETAPTEIYTYLHTLSLHDALPIFGALFGSVGDVFLHLGHGVAVDQRTLYHAVGKAVAHLHGFDFGGQALDQVFIDTRLDRSEEHTSELQSLMRISYAVCCLKKTQ